MSSRRRIAFIGNHLPRQCGIATFTHDLRGAVAAARLDWETGVVAITQPGCSHAYPPEVLYEIREDVVEDYRDAAAFLEARGTDLVCLQHEFGIFGGPAGEYVLQLLSRLTVPLVTTLHTVLDSPNPAQRRVMDRIIARSSTLIVMAERARTFLRGVHDVPEDRIKIIAHGVPDVPWRDPADVKATFGLEGRPVILTFGLLSPNKGIETVLDAMPAILRVCPNAVYVVLGATHPNLVREQGEQYRERLTAQARAVGAEDNVRFVNQFVDQQTLLNHIAMCDVYVTPYLNEAQMTSGTLSYAFGLGAAVVSTPYWHATELLRDDLGVLVPFGDSNAVGREISRLVTDEEARNAMRRRAYATGRRMAWPEIGSIYAEVMDLSARRVRVTEPKPPRRLSAISDASALPEIRLDHLLSFCDGTGLSQHGKYTIPDREYGYCTDDNARALLLACALERLGEPKMPADLTSRFAAFLQHAWNPATRRFRNFMSYDRVWTEDIGSEDSHARALWALGDYVRTGVNRRPSWADALFLEALPSAETFVHPRAWAFTLLGLDPWCHATGGDLAARGVRAELANRLTAMSDVRGSEEWIWFEEALAYDNARLSQALIQTGTACDDQRQLSAGLRTLEWLMARQTTHLGLFRPVGTDSFGRAREAPRPFDQQPLEVAASISACLAAWRATQDPIWHARAITAFRWFLGHNDLATGLADIETGGCADGLHPGGRNENMGAESMLSYLLGLAELRSLSRSVAVSDRTRRRLASG